MDITSPRSAASLAFLALPETVLVKHATRNLRRALAKTIMPRVDDNDKPAPE